jgi:adenylylsulfate kinase-like enzyme
MEQSVMAVQGAIKNCHYQLNTSPVRKMIDGRLVIWLTGLTAAGKTTIAEAIHSELHSRGFAVEFLDGDAMRRSLSGTWVHAGRSGRKCSPHRFCCVTVGPPRGNCYYCCDIAL